MRTGSVDLIAWASREELVAVCGVDRTTAARWKAGAARPTIAALRLLALYLGGAVGPAAGAGWSGWWFDRDGMLCCPDWARMRIGPDELRAYLFFRYGGVSVAEIAATLDAHGPGRRVAPVMHDHVHDQRE